MTLIIQPRQLHQRPRLFRVQFLRNFRSDFDEFGAAGRLDLQHFGDDVPGPCGNGEAPTRVRVGDQWDLEGLLGGG